MMKVLGVSREFKNSRSEFKASIDLCRRMMRRKGLSLRRCTSLAQRLPSDYAEKLISYQSMDGCEDSVLWDEEFDGDDPNATSRDEEIGDRGD
ncbi:hypothetical protein J437_LFUL006376 [Ladona fulva]|uniref:Uncharacterized protein n=1 Tax=Ladona fulva TaxID=123851 RepID=A0A8K0NZX5_LADFU|nr:hypothetical protein J437_LFUL006376 [Ladona fulva]